MYKTKIKKFLAYCATFLSVCALNMHSANAEPIKVEDLARNEAIQSVRLSPDGKHIAALVGTDQHKHSVISVWDTEELSEKPYWIPTKEMMYVWVDFLGNDQLIWLNRDKRVYGSLKTLEHKLVIADLDGGSDFEPTKAKGSQGDDVSFGIFYEFADKERIYLTQSSDGIQKIVEVNLKTNKRRNIAEASESYTFLSEGVHPETGDLLLKQSLRIEGGRYFLDIHFRKDSKSAWVHQEELSFEFTNRSTLSVQGFDGSIERMVVVTNKDQNFAEARIYNPISQKWLDEPLLSVDGFDIFNVYTEYPSGKNFTEVTGMTVSGPFFEQFLFDEYWAGISQQLKTAFPDANVVITDRLSPEDAGRYMAIVSIDASNIPTTYFLFDNGQLKPLGNQLPWLDKEDLPTQEWVTYSARDGLQIPGILSLPAGYNKEKDGPIPTIIHPHGGPWARDSMGWDYSGWVPFFTSRGVAVLQPQYRGSADLGMNLWKAGDEEWGQKMQDDKDDGAKWLVDQGIADPDKIAIMGYSYGGFAAIAASVRPNSPYQCAIAGAGVSNLDKLANLWGGNRIQRAYQGWTVDGLDPIENVKNASIPIMLYHGDHDRQADTYHSRDFYKAMKRAGKDVEYTEIKYMWHQLPWWPEWESQTLTLMEDYLASDKCGLLEK